MTNADFDLHDILAWARTKPADERYEFADAGTCALGQYARLKGWSEGDARCAIYEKHVSSDLKFAANPCGPIGCPWDLVGGTFGHFVKRLEALLPAKPISNTWVKADAYMADLDCVQA